MIGYTLQNHVDPIAGADLSTSEGLAVYATGSPVRVQLLDDGANQAATQQLVPLGILVRGGESGERVDVAREGQVTMIAGATVTAGEAIVAENATARGIPAATDVEGDQILGRALTGAADGGFFTLELMIQVVRL